MTTTPNTSNTGIYTIDQIYNEMKGWREVQSAFFDFYINGKDTNGAEFQKFKDLYYRYNSKYSNTDKSNAA